MLVAFSGCAMGERKNTISDVFTADAENRADYLTDPKDIALWDELDLDNVTLSDENTQDLQAGDVFVKRNNAEVGESMVPLYFIEGEDGKWRLDLDASFGLNEEQMTQWDSSDGIVTVRVYAELVSELPSQYAGREETHYAVKVADPQGESTLTAVFNRQSADGGALYALLSDGARHPVLLDLRAMDMGRNQTVWRIVRYRGENWLDESAVLRLRHAGLLEAVQSGDAEKAKDLFTQESLAVTDQNGDGLLFLALRGDHYDLAEWLISQSAGDFNDNLYWHDAAYLLDFERDDMTALTGALRESGGNPGCTAESIGHYFARYGGDAAMTVYLSHFAPQAELSALESRELAIRYGLVSEAPQTTKTAAKTLKTAAAQKTESVSTANLVDVALLNRNAQTAATLLNGGATASDLLKEMLRTDPTFFSDDLLTVLGAHNYFGVLSEVLDDYRIFRDDTREKAGEQMDRFAEDYAKYLEVAGEDDIFTVAGIMDSYLLKDIVDQLVAVKTVSEPQTPAVKNLRELLIKYADTMDTAGYYYKRIARTTNTALRQNSRRMFKLRLEQADALRNEYLKETALYDDLLLHVK